MASRFRPLAALVTAFVMMVAACGSDDANTESGTSTTTPDANDGDAAVQPVVLVDADGDDVEVAITDQSITITPLDSTSVLTEYVIEYENRHTLIGAVA